MTENNINTPAQILDCVSNAGILKTKRQPYKQMLLAFLAGAFIAFASEGSNMAAFNLIANTDTYGLGRLVSGMVFGTGLMLVIIAGGELFTGNMLIIVSALDKKITFKSMLNSWFFVYLGNFIGAIFIVVMIFYSGLLNSGSGLLGGVTIKIAFGKVNIPFISAFISAVMCNWLVCLAVWMSYAARDITGKIMSIFFVIGLFVVSGYEHCIANMYYIPAGILAKSNVMWAEKSSLSLGQLSSLNWSSFFLNNLLPVTLGNIVGGAIFVGCFYWLIYKEKSHESS